jgi:hypothetical protein
MRVQDFMCIQFHNFHPSDWRQEKAVMRAHKDIRSNREAAVEKALSLHKGRERTNIDSFHRAIKFAHLTSPNFFFSSIVLSFYLTLNRLPNFHLFMDSTKFLIPFQTLVPSTHTYVYTLHLWAYTYLFIHFHKLPTNHNPIVTLFFKCTIWLMYHIDPPPSFLSNSPHLAKPRWETWHDKFIRVGGAHYSTVPNNKVVVKKCVYIYIFVCQKYM